MNNNWICTSILMKRNSIFIGEEYNYSETYEFANTNDIIEPLKDTSDNILSIVESSNNIVEGMITMKKGEKYVNRVFFNKNEPKMDFELPLVPSKHIFISIKYKHPRMEEPIFIDIDKEYYYSNNELLSPLFIKRYLEYQPYIYDFDMDYELEVMDNDINSYKLSSKQYILLADCTYTIKNIE
jgi:bifunctional DNase/RNase